MLSRILLIIFSLFIAFPSVYADNEVTGPDMTWGGESDEEDDFDDSKTDIQTPPDAKDNTIYYDLQGRKVTTLVKGKMYICKGKKFIAK